MMDKREIFTKLRAKGVLDNIPDDIYLKIMYRVWMGKKLNLDNPQTFNEKLQWLKLHDHNPQYTNMVDKYEAKELVSNRWGSDLVIPTLGVWNRYDEINFDSLPDSFVLKCTHDSGGLVLVKDKKAMNHESAKKKIECSLRTNYYNCWREWPYKNVAPRIIAEPYMDGLNDNGLIDYKIMCFNGEVKCSFTCTNRFKEGGLCVNFYDKAWNPLPFTRDHPKRPVEVEKPHNYDRMVEIAEETSKNLDFLRVDFYEISNKLYFGEFTFYPGSGIEASQPEIWDLRLGQMIRLSKKGKCDS